MEPYSTVVMSNSDTRVLMPKMHYVVEKDGTFKTLCGLTNVKPYGKILKPFGIYPICDKCYSIFVGGKPED